MILYRPVGLQEMELIYDSGMKAFPARLPQQPIFYPVLDLEYARQTAADWNVKNGQFAGYVTQFKVEDDYIGQFEKHTVGESGHEEYWIPAEEVEEFNKHIIGHIKVVEAYIGDEFQGFVPDKYGMQGKNAVAQFTMLANQFIYSRMDFYLEIKRNHKAVFLNYPFWQKQEFKNKGLKEKMLQSIKEVWLTSFPKTPLVNLAQEETPPAKPIDSRPLAAPKQKDAAQVKQTDSSISLGVDDEDIQSEEDIDWEEDDDWSEEETNSPASVNPQDEKSTPEERIDSPVIVDPVDEDSTPDEPDDSPLPAKPVDEQPRPTRPTFSRPFVNPVREEPRPVRQPESHFVQGVKLGLSGKYEEAIDELSRAVKENPSHVAAQTSLGVAFHRVGEDDRALSSYEAVLKKDRKNAEAHYFRANILYSRGNVREAITEYTTALGLKPQLIEADQKPVPQDRLTDYIPYPAELNRFVRAARRVLEMSKLLDANPRQAALFKARAAEYSRLGNYEQAIVDYNSSLAIQPDDANVLHLRGLAYEQMGQTDRAQKDYQQAIAIDPQLSDMYINRGVALGQTGNFRQSIASLSEGIRLAPENPNGYFNRGVTYFQQGDFERAIEDFSNVIRLSPGDDAAYYWRGISHEEAGRQREAIADYRKFLALSRDENTREEIEQKLRQWNDEKRESADSRRAVADDRQKTNQAQPAKQDQPLDLYDLVAALGERALNSTWFGSGVNCTGENAEELYAFADQNQPMDGNDFLRITSGIRQTIQGDFQAIDSDTSFPWVFIRAWNGNGFYLETNDPKIKARLKSRFQSMEDVEGVNAPYEGLFIGV